MCLSSTLQDDFGIDRRNPKACYYFLFNPYLLLCRLAGKCGGDIAGGCHLQTALQCLLEICLLRYATCVVIKQEWRGGGIEIVSTSCAKLEVKVLSPRRLDRWMMGHYQA